MPPDKFAIKSSMSDERPMKYWKLSMPNVSANTVSTVIWNFLIRLTAIGANNPNGINTAMFGTISVLILCKIFPSHNHFKGWRFNADCSGSKRNGKLNRIIVANTTRKKDQKHSKKHNCRAKPRSFFLKTKKPVSVKQPI